MRPTPPPFRTPVTDGEGNLTPYWYEFLERLYLGDTGTVWESPTFTNLGTTGTPTITGTTYRISQNLVYFSVRIVPATNTSSTAGSTYIDNFPFSIRQDGVCSASSGLVSDASGMIEAATNRIYTPPWTNITVPITITGTVEVN